MKKINIIIVLVLLAVPASLRGQSFGAAAADVKKQLEDSLPS